MYASDFVRLYSLLNSIEYLQINSSPEVIGRLRAEAAMARIALDVCVVRNINNVELLNEVSACKQESDVNGSPGNNGVQV
jgi:hypothetical protein